MLDRVSVPGALSASEPCSLGVDLGTSGLRLALTGCDGTLIAEASSPYPVAFEDPRGWREGLIDLVRSLGHDLRARVGAVALAGTSGTLLLCRPDGTLAPAPLDRALPYHQACPEQATRARELAGDGAAASASGSLARALRLLTACEDAAIQGPWLLRHQADWLMGWLLGTWHWGEEGNNLRLGWDLERHRWSGSIAKQRWASALPSIRCSGEPLGVLTPAAAERLGLPPACLVVAGSTDANAGVLAADLTEGDGVTVLGTTLVLKQFAAKPIHGPGLSCHRVAGRWLVGGASNAGAGILLRFFRAEQIPELSRSIDPTRPSGLRLRPLPAAGERFPVDDPALPPVLTPRPVSDALYLQALLEGLAAIEAQGWQRLQALGAPPLQRVITLGGGARNPQWRGIRQRLLGVPVLNRPRLTPALGMARLAAAGWALRPPQSP